MQIRYLMHPVTTAMTGAAEPTEPPAASTKASRIFIACARCKARKSRCDGARPKCRHCAARGALCDYAPVRKTRGPGKSKKHSAKENGPTNETLLTLVSSSTQPPEASSEEPSTETAAFAPPSASLNTTSIHFEPKVKPRTIAQVAADFLVPGVFQHRKELDNAIADVTAGRRQFTPLLPVHVTRRLIQNVFDQILAPHQLISLVDLITLIGEQYEAGVDEPAGSPARWALVNTVLALALRYKIAPGAEAELSVYPRALFQNATAVLPGLVLQESGLLPIQALLVMAIFAQGEKDPGGRMFVMLVTCAARLVELLLSGQAQMVSVQDQEQCGRAYTLAASLEQVAVHTYGIRAILGSTGGDVWAG